MKTARNLIAVGIKLATGMQLRHHHLGGRNTLFLVDLHRYAAAIIDNGNRVVQVNRDRDLGAETG